MKKILVLFYLVFISLLVFPQGVRFGIFVEPKISWLTPDVNNINTSGTKMGVNIGLIVDNYFTKNYAFATGISINNVGGKLEFTDNTREIETSTAVNTIDQNTIVTYKLQYVNIPLGLRLKTNPMGYLSFCSNVGIAPQINIKAKADSEENGINDENIKEAEISLFNLGYHIGGGIEYSIGGNSAITANIIYTNNFLDIAKNDDYQINMSNVSLKIGLIF